MSGMTSAAVALPPRKACRLPPRGPRPGPRLLEETEGDLVGAPGPLLDLRDRLLEPGLEVAPQVPPAVDVGDELARVDLLERRHRDLEVLEEARHLARVRQRHERHPAERGEDQE